VSVAASPFTDPGLVRGALYASAGRLASRSGALHRARASGRHAGQVITSLAADALGPVRVQARVADIGCGRGTTTRMLAQRLPAADVIAIDLSAAMLAVVQDRLAAGWHAAAVRADFGQLPLASGTCDVAVAAFCLYHAACPGQVIGEIARCLRAGGMAILATKSTDSYRELDHLVAEAGLDPDALSRPSLYQAAHSGNLAALTSRHMDVQQVIHHPHRFAFASLDCAAEYLATSPKYDLPAALVADPAAIAAVLRQRLPEGPITATSTVSYVTAIRRRASSP
jgi:SAM-dependent methyltransferase